MRLTVKRIAKRDTYTIGRLFIDDRYFCDTLEDKDRGLNYTMPLKQIQSIKVKKQTAIPTGIYTISMNIISPAYSKKANFAFTGGRMPRLLGVPGWEGVLIHSGNTIDHTEGCLLVGLNTVKGQVTNSFNTFKKLWKMMDERRDEGIIISIE